MFFDAEFLSRLPKPSDSDAAIIRFAESKRKAMYPSANIVWINLFTFDPDADDIAKVDLSTNSVIRYNRLAKIRERL